MGACLRGKVFASLREVASIAGILPEYLWSFLLKNYYVTPKQQLGASGERRCEVYAAYSTAFECEVNRWYMSSSLFPEGAVFALHGKGLPWANIRGESH